MSLIIASGISMIIASGGMNILVTLVKSKFRANKVLNKKVIKSDLNVIIKRNCIDFFKGVPLQTTSGFIGEDALPQKIPLKANTPFEVDQIQPHIKFHKLISDNQYLSELTLQNPAGKELAQILFFALIEDGTMTSCGEEPQAGNISATEVEIKELTCEIDFTSEKGRCELKEVGDTLTYRACLTGHSCSPWVSMGKYADVWNIVGDENTGLRCRYYKGTGRILMRHTASTRKNFTCYNRLRYAL